MMKSKGWERSSVVSLTPGENENSRANLVTYVERICFVHMCRDFTSVHDVEGLGVEVLGQEPAHKCK
jgi:hypothetical protein